MLEAIMGIGVPGSGKTTLLKPLAEKKQYEYICPDDIREELTDDAKNQSVTKEAWAIAEKRMEEAFKSGKSVIVDGTFLRQNERRAWICRLRELGITNIEGYYVNIPVEIAKDRNAKRERNVPEYEIDRMNSFAAKFPPSLPDGFDVLRIFDENLKEIQIFKKG